MSLLSTCFVSFQNKPQYTLTYTRSLRRPTRLLARLANPNLNPNPLSYPHAVHHRPTHLSPPPQVATPQATTPPFPAASSASERPMVHCSGPLHRTAEKHGRMEAKTFASVAFAAVAPVVAPAAKEAWQVGATHSNPSYTRDPHNSHPCILPHSSPCCYDIYSARHTASQIYSRVERRWAGLVYCCRRTNQG